MEGESPPPRQHRRMAQSGSAPGREPGGRRFKSCFSDHHGYAWELARTLPDTRRRRQKRRAGHPSPRRRRQEARWRAGRSPRPARFKSGAVVTRPEGSRGTAPRWYRGHGGFDSRSGLQSQECDDLLEDACGVRGGDCSNLSRPPHNNRPVDDGDCPALCGGQTEAASHRHRTPFVPCGSERRIAGASRSRVSSPHTRRVGRAERLPVANP